MGLGDFTKLLPSTIGDLPEQIPSSLGKYVPVQFTTGQIGDFGAKEGMPSLNGLKYDFDIADQIGIKPELERQLLKYKSKLLPAWLRIGFPTNNPKSELGNEIAPTEPGDMVRYENDYLNIRSYAQDFARPSRYEVQFTPPVLSSYTDMVMPSIVNAALPGKTLTTMDDRQGGPNIIKKPFDVVYEDVTLTFQVSDSMIERDMISEWINAIFKDSTQTFAYMDGYAADIYIKQFSTQKDWVKTIELLNAYPITMSEIALGYDMTDAIETFTVTFAYEKWVESTRKQ